MKPPLRLKAPPLRGPVLNPDNPLRNNPIRPFALKMKSPGLQNLLRLPGLLK